MKREQQQQQVFDWIEKFPDSGAELIALGTQISKLNVYKILKALSESGRIKINKDTHPPYSIIKDETQSNEQSQESTNQVPTSEENDAPKTFNGRDTSKFKFQGKEYGKGQLVLAVIREHTEKNPTISLDKLKEQFPDELQPRYGTIKELSQAKKLSVDRDRFFLKPEQILSVGNKKIAVSNQWGANNITPFIAAAKKLGYKIK